METSSQQQMWLLFFKEDRTEGKVGVEKAPPSLLLPGWHCGLCTQHCTETALPGGQSLPCAGATGTFGRCHPLCTHSRWQTSPGPCSSLLPGCAPLLAYSASHLTDHDFSAAFAPPSGCGHALSGSSILPGKSGTEARTQTFSRLFSRINDTGGARQVKAPGATGQVSGGAVLP